MDHRERQLLWAARETGALEALVTSADDPAALVADTDLTAEAAAVLVTALTERGYLERVGERYEPTDALLGVLTTTDVRSVGTLPATLDDADRLAALPATLEGGTPPRQDEAALVHDLGAAAADRAGASAVATAAREAAPAARRVLVLPGAPGRVAVALATGDEDGPDPDLSVTAADRPVALAAAEAVLAGTDVGTHPTGTPLGEGDPLPEADLVVTPVGRRRLAPASEALVAAAARAVTDGGTVVHVDRLGPTADPLDPPMDLATRGAVRTRDPERLLEGTGLEREGVREVGAGGLTALVARSSD